MTQTALRRGDRVGFAYIPTDAELATVTITDAELDQYLRTYPEYTPSSVIRALKAVKWKWEHLDSHTVNKHVVEKRFDGLGMGESWDRDTIHTLIEHLQTALRQ